MLINIVIASLSFIALAKDVCVDNCVGGNNEPREQSRLGRSADEKPPVSNTKLANEPQNKMPSPTISKELESPLESAINKSEPYRKVFKQPVVDSQKMRLYKIKDAESNLPDYLQDLPANAEHDFVFTPKVEANDVLFGVNRGSMIKVIIRQNIKASPNVPTPVVGEVITENLKGYYVYGEATLENDLKRVLFKFTSLSGSVASYTFKGCGIDPQGRVGMEGDHHAEDWKYGIASFLSTGAAIAIDSQVERTPTITGNYSEAPSVANAVKKGVAGSFGKVAERMADRASQVPGFTEIEGPLYLTVVVEDKPRITR